ncbi:tRNA lysidine(34) synthetase TilS [Falsibacillus pallidus]|uniref:tRNA(Ile)-lysidine synthase n=1 Tax=Falsibacillus pallidus TaxID=493781 RepID=A0A370G3V1_9BACI|nr:tRNA lysidine(34) synthetase TilS [Falsibacillus pallidus]RDI38425.1 tRNA(Ile)-lysidine synthase [Falsibacillus pallidus]
MFMLAYERKVSAFIERHGLVEKGDRILVAASGGPDSLSLLHFLSRRTSLYGIGLACITVDHMLRGRESHEDILFMERFCATLGIPCETASIDIKAKMADEGKGMQETARYYRYLFFEETLQEKGYTAIATGHHGDDQAETILMRLTRGAVGKSRAGIPVQRPFGSGRLIRPLLSLNKNEIEEYCRFYELKPRRDPSNEKDDYTRNRFRHRVLPALREENPNFHEQFQRFGEELREDEVFLQELTREEMNKLWNKHHDQISFEITRFHQMPLPLQRRGIQLILNYLYEELPSSISAVHIDAVQQLLKSSSNVSGQLDFPHHLKVIRSYNHCCFTFRPSGRTDPYEFELPLQGEINLPNASSIIAGDLNSMPLKNGNSSICLDTSMLNLPLIVRTRRDGDRIAAKGLNGTKKVKDIFIDSKIPVHMRESWPIVTDQSGEILWLPGIKKSKYDIEQAADKPLLILHFNPQTSSRGTINS